MGRLVPFTVMKRRPQAAPTTPPRPPSTDVGTALSRCT